MKILIAAVGKFRPGPEQQLFEEYRKRIPWKVELKEIRPAKRMEEEAESLLAATADCHKRVLLDERGKTLSSREIADQLKAWQMEGDTSIGFMIGGADGVTDALRKRANLVLSFGRASWPHMLVRAMLAEQLYRAHTVLSGHPYHRD